VNRADRHGRFGRFGGRFVPEVLVAPLLELEREYRAARKDRGFAAELSALLRDYSGRPTPVTFAARLTEHSGGARILLKREDLNHTGSHKINNTLGQVLLARRMGKTRLIAETGAGQHGVATATAAALFGLPCRVYMGTVDVARQSHNVERMRLLGAEVVPVAAGDATLKEATSEAMREWAQSHADTFYVIGSVVGPHPYPTIVGDFQSVIGREARGQVLAREGRLPDVAVACVGGGSNAAGLFTAFLKDPVALFGAEGGGRGPGETSASLSFGRPGVLHGALSYLLQDADGQVAPTHSAAAGLDYPGVGPLHANLLDSGRVTYRPVLDQEALAAALLLARLEGIIPALESAHAVSLALSLAAAMPKEKIVLVNLSGRGDKDLPAITEGRES
jgi:tryptophan synthase beta chain